MSKKRVRVIEKKSEDTAEKKPKSVYPKDQILELLGSYIDKDGVTHMQYEITSPSNSEDKTQIEILVKKSSIVSPSAIPESIISENVLPMLQLGEKPKESVPTTKSKPKSPSGRKPKGAKKKEELVEMTEEPKIKEGSEVLAEFPHYSVITGTKVFGRRSLSPRFRSILEDTQVLDISHIQPVQASTSTDTVGSVFQKLVKGNILSLPVYNDEVRFVGFIDILDVLHYLCQKVVDPWNNPSLYFNWWGSWHSIEDIANTKCSDIINISKRNPTFFAKHDDSIQHVIDEMSTLNLHRIGILKENGLVAILTQTKLLEFFFKQDFLCDIGNISMMTIGQLHLGFRPVHTTTLKTRALDAFKDMITHNVSGLAVVENGEILGNLSARDLKTLGYELSMFQKLFMSVKEFLGDNAKPPLTVTPFTTLKDTVKIFMEEKVHRVYVVDGKDLVGVITPAEIIKCFQTRPHNFFAGQ